MSSTKSEIAAVAATVKTRTEARSRLTPGRISTLNIVENTSVLLRREPGDMTTSLPHRAEAQGSRPGIAPHRTKRQRLSHPTSFARPPPRDGGLRHATDCPFAFCLASYKPNDVTRFASEFALAAVVWGCRIRDGLSVF